MPGPQHAAGLGVVVGVNHHGLDRSTQWFEENTCSARAEDLRSQFFRPWRCFRRRRFLGPTDLANIGGIHHRGCCTCSSQSGLYRIDYDKSPFIRLREHTPQALGANTCIYKSCVRTRITHIYMHCHHHHYHPVQAAYTGCPYVLEHISKHIMA